MIAHVLEDKVTQVVQKEKCIALEIFDPQKWRPPVAVAGSSLPTTTAAEKGLQADRPDRRADGLPLVSI